jgi:hypothetical protein
MLPNKLIGPMPARDSPAANGDESEASKSTLTYSLESSSPQLHDVRLVFLSVGSQCSYISPSQADGPANRHGMTPRDLSLAVM